MDTKAQSYAGIVIDASFFVKPFSEKFRQLLDGVPVYHARTWKNVVLVMGAGLEEPHKGYFEDNLRDLRRVKPKVPAGVPCTEDVVGMIGSLASLGAARGQRYLFASADRMLLQRLILEQVRIDIYDLWTDKCVSWEVFPGQIQELEFTRVPQDPAPTADTTQEALVLYDEAGAPVRLNKTNDGGSEATMYTCPARPNCLAKIYKKSVRRVILDGNKIQNVANLQRIFSENPGFSWAKVPLEKLYLEPERRNVVGFLMENAGQVTLLSELDTLNEEKENVEVCQTVRLCLRVIRQVACLSIYGFSVYDYNNANFAQSAEKPGCVQMLDTDSFCSGNYFTSFHTQDLCVRSRFQAGQTTKAEALRICTELAYIYAGYTLLRKKNPLYNNGTLREAGDRLWLRVPKNVRELLFRVFGGGLGHLPQFDILLSELMKAERMLKGKHIAYNRLEELEELEPEPEEVPEPAPKPGPEPEDPGTQRKDPTGEAGGDRAGENGTWNIPEDSGEPEEPESAVDWEEDGGFDEFQVDDTVFQPSGRMLIQQAPPAAGPRKHEDRKEYYFAPAPLRELYGREEPADDTDRDAARRLGIKRGIYAAAAVFAALFVCWLLFGADPGWVAQLRETVSGTLEWLREQWESLWEALAGLVEKIRWRISLISKGV